MRRDDRARVGRCRSREAATVCPSFGLERTGENAERWTAALRAAHGRLTAALAEHRHLRSKRVFCQDDRTPLTRQIVQNRMILAARRANVRRGVHILRHTFCSHLSMRGRRRGDPGARRARDLGMTQRYMHLSPAALDAAIRLLDRPSGDQSCGDMLATGSPLQKRSMNRGTKLAVRQGFEPWVQVLGPYNGLANRRLQPLGHLTVLKLLRILRVSLGSTGHQRPYCAQNCALTGSKPPAGLRR